MSYVNNTEIQQRVGAPAYVQLTDDDGDNVPDVAVVDEARLASEGTVNSYLARRYAVPIDLAVHADLAPLLKSITLDLVEQRLRQRRPPVPAGTTARYQEALQWLQAVADATVELPAATTVPSRTVRGPIAQTTGDDRMLSREELADH